MASEPYERPQLPSPARALNERQRLIGAPPEVGTGAHLTVTEDGAVAVGALTPPTGRSVLYPPIELSYDSPDVMLDSQSANGWAVGLSEDQVRTIVAIGGTYDQRVYLAEGYRQLNASNLVAPTDRRRAPPRYVNPSDAANPDSAGLVTETLHEREVTAEEKQKRSRIAVPAESVSGEVPVAFTEVDALSLRIIPAVVRKRVRGARGSRGEVKDFRGRPLDR